MTYSLKCPSLNAIVLGVLLTSNAQANGPSHTECLTAGYCLCISDALQPLITQKVEHFIYLLRQAHAGNKIAVYTSVPLSTGSGSYFGTNREVATNIAAHLESRFGAGRIWVLSPATPEADLPRPTATQADYMYMWSQVIFGAEKASNGFDLIYFAGPRDFSRYFHLTGQDDLANLDSYFKNRQASDADFAKLIEAGKMSLNDFETYYGLRASVSFSVGAHDEWNIVQKINDARRTSKGVLSQLPMLFDGEALPIAAYEEAVVNGNVGACK
jgi:hypothetical protein